MRLKREQINIRCAPRLKQRLARLAREEEKTLAEYIREVLERHINEKETAKE